MDHHEFLTTSVDMPKEEFDAYVAAHGSVTANDERAMQVVVPHRRRWVWLALAALAAAVVFSIPAFASDYQCRNTLGCTAQISENGMLKTVNFRKGDIVCTEDGWIVSTEDGWKKLKKKRSTPASMGHGTGAGFFTAAQARGPFVIYRAISPAVSQRWNGTLVLVSAGEFVASGYDTPTGPGWMEVGKQKGKL